MERGFAPLGQRRCTVSSPDVPGTSRSGKTTLTCPKKWILFSQGDAADAVFYIQTGQVKLTVISSQGKEAIVAMLEPGAFFGEECLAGSWCAWERQPLRKNPRSPAVTNRR
jgi:CRP-like cAMP-binding protein